MMGRIKTWEAHRDVGWKGVRIIYGILFGAIILNAQLILSAAPNHPQTRLSSHDEENVQLSGPVARPGGPYYTMEGAEVRLNGSASRGSLGGSLEIDYLRMVNQPEGAPTDRDAGMAMDSYGNIHIVWLREAEHNPVTQGTLSLLYSRRNQDGSFTTPTVLRSNPSGLLAFTPSIATYGRAVYVAWGGVDGVLFIRSLDGGGTFEPQAYVYNGRDHSEYNVTWVGALVKVDQIGRIFVAWDRILPYSWRWSDLCVSRSDDGGLTFGPPVTVNKIPTVVKYSGDRPAHSIAFDTGGNPMLAWIDSRYDVFNVFFSKSYDGGHSFPSPLTLTHNQSKDPVYPRLAVTPGGTIHVAWRDWDDPFPSFNISLSSSDDGGKTFSPIRIVSDEPGYIDFYGNGLNLESSLNGTLYLFWSAGYIGHERVRVSVSHDNGSTFSSGLLVDSFDSRQYCDSLVLLDNSSFALLWTDKSITRVPGKDYNVMYAEGSDAAPIVSYKWDMDASVDVDGDGNPVNDIDAVGPTPILVYGDDGNYSLTLTVVDAMNRTASAQTFVMVVNVPPAIEAASCTMSRPSAEVWARVAGEKWHDVAVAFYEGGVETNNVTMVRAPGSPNDQEAFLGKVNGTSGVNYSVTMWYSPDDDPENGQPGGATPAWVVLKFEDGNNSSMHHLFNVNHPDSWIWIIPNLLDSLASKRVVCKATASDPGSDDLAFRWEFSDGTNLTSHYPNFDGTFPVRITDAVTHYFRERGASTVVLTVTDDDGGSTARTFNLLVSRAGVPHAGPISDIHHDWREPDPCDGASQTARTGRDVPGDPPPPRWAMRSLQRISPTGEEADPSMIR